jgi:hypothetical protein
LQTDQLPRERSYPIDVTAAVRHEHADPPHAVALLRARRERPRRRAAEPSDEFTPSKPHLTLRARKRYRGKIARPVLRVSHHWSSARRVTRGSAP